MERTLQKSAFQFVHLHGFPGGSACKESACNVGDTGDMGSLPGSERPPWRRKWLPTPVFLPGESHEHRSLLGYSLWGCKESNMTEQLTQASNSRCLSSVQFSRSVVSNSLRPHEQQHSRPPCLSPTPGVYSNTCLSSR